MTDYFLFYLFILFRSLAGPIGTRIFLGCAEYERGRALGGQWSKPASCHRHWLQGKQAEVCVLTGSRLKLQRCEGASRRNSHIARVRAGAAQREGDSGENEGLQATDTALERQGRGDCVVGLARVGWLGWHARTQAPSQPRNCPYSAVVSGSKRKREGFFKGR